jgi:TIR domain
MLVRYDARGLGFHSLRGNPVALSPSDGALLLSFCERRFSCCVTRGAEMFVFVAHTHYHKEFAIETAQRIREAGHDALAGEQILFNFSKYSFREAYIARALRDADALVAFGLHPAWHRNVAAEIAFFSGHSTVDRTILVTTHDLDSRTPSYLLGRHVVYFEGNEQSTIEEILVHLATIRTRHRRGADQIFLSYSRTDLDSAKSLHELLVGHGYKVWFDQHTLIAGQDWEIEIRKPSRIRVHLCHSYRLVQSRHGAISRKNSEEALALQKRCPRVRSSCRHLQPSPRCSRR